MLKSGELNDNQNISDSEEKISEIAVENSSAKIFSTNTILLQCMVQQLGSSVFYPHLQQQTKR